MRKSSANACVHTVRNDPCRQWEQRRIAAVMKQLEGDTFRTILLPENRGFAAGCNRGIEKASGDFICLLNTDVIVTRCWLKKMLACMETTGAGMVGPCTDHAAKGKQLFKLWRAGCCPSVSETYPAGRCPSSFLDVPSVSETYRGGLIPLLLLCPHQPQGHHEDWRIGRAVRPGNIRGQRLLPKRT